jgi:hypothetical protein
MKDEVNPVPQHHDIKAYWGVDVKLHVFLTLESDGGYQPVSIE